MSENNTSSGSIGFVGVLQIVFITLKLLEKIDWPWIWVLSPMWISFVLIIIIILIVIIIYLIIDYFKWGRLK